MHVSCSAPLPDLKDHSGSKGVCVVFWADDVPLGHQMISADELPLSRDELAERARAATAPAVQAYVAQTSQPGRNDEPMSGAVLSLPWTLPACLFSADGQASELSVSVVVCTRDRPELLRRTLESISRLSPRPDETLVVDNAPRSEATRRIVDQMADVRYVLEPRPGLDVARNAAVRHSRGELIAFADDDVVVHPAWIRGLQRGFRETSVVAVTGLVLPAELETDSQYLFEKYWGFNRGFCPKVYGRAYFEQYRDYGVPVWEIGAGANMAFRRDVFAKVGLFDERLDVGAAGCSGDSEFWYRILAERYECRYEPTAVTFHYHRRDEAGFKRQIAQYMRGHVAALLIQYEKYRHLGNLRRLLRDMPQFYFQSAHRSLLRYEPRYTTLSAEISGCFSGVTFYLTHRRQRAARTASLAVPTGPSGTTDVTDSTASCVTDRTQQPTLVSVVIPCYNQAHFLGEAIQSALEQTYKPVEIVVVDDGSTDDTERVAASYSKVWCIRTGNQGLSAARNVGIRVSHGKYIVFLDADDRLLPPAVEAGVDAIRKQPEAAFVFGVFRCIDANGAPLAEASLPQAAQHARLGDLKRNYSGNDHYCPLMQGNYIGMHGTVMYRRGVLEAVRGFNEQLVACEDYDLYLRVARELPVFYHGQVVAEYRQHAGNMSRDRQRMLKSALAVLESQREFFHDDAARLAAYRRGIEFWNDYYHLECEHPG